MGTKHLARAQKALDARPGGTSMRARKYAKITLAVLSVALVLGLGLLFAEVSTPGMAWYVYE